MNRKLHWVVRYGVFMILSFNIAMMVSANTAAGASVTAAMTLGNDQTVFPSFFTFSLVNTVKDFWQAKVYFLSLLVAILSGAWPYAKLLMMMSAWVLPSTILSIKRREKMLIMLDALGKWSLVDTFIMVMFQIAFHFVIAMDIPTTVPGYPNSTEYTEIELRVVSEWGFMGFMIVCLCLYPTPCMSRD
jgi:hypothetical protein